MKIWLVSCLFLVKAPIPFCSDTLGTQSSWKSARRLILRFSQFMDALHCLLEICATLRGGRTGFTMILGCNKEPVGNGGLLLEHWMASMGR